MHTYKRMYEVCSKNNSYFQISRVTYVRFAHFFLRFEMLIVEFGFQLWNNRFSIIVESRIREVADVLGISFGSCQAIFTNV